MDSALPLLVVLAAVGSLGHAISPVHAQDAAPPADQGQSHRTPHQPAEDTTTDQIVVTGHPPVDFGILAARSSIGGDVLVAETRGQIGETLAGLPGVSATSFAPGASRPVLRGMSGERAAVLVDGLGSIDASAVSADHALVLDMLTVDHVDVFHGPAVLLFGGNAIGGAVNALDARIPRRVADRVEGTVLGSYGTAADERAAGGSVQFPLAPRLAASFDANWRKSDDLRVGGLVHSAPMRDQMLDKAAEHRAEGEIDEARELEGQALLSGRVPNSAARTYTLGAGLAFIDAGGDLGVSVQRYDTRYGVPLRPGTEHHHHHHGHENSESHEEHETVTIDLVQTRIDLRGSLELGGWLDSLQVRGAYGDYQHIELEGDEVGTRFSSEGIEFRAELVQAKRGNWRGRSGVHYVHRQLAAEGAEAFVPNYTVERVGLFTLQAIDLGSGFELEGAGRYERARVDSPQTGFGRGFDLWSGAAGLSFAPADGWTLGLNYVHGARAPSPEELLSDGLHVATQAFEQGHRSFAIEKSEGVEAYVQYASPRTELSLTAYLTDFDGFITALPTGEEEEGFPVFRYEQLPARFKGFEASGSHEALRWADGALRLEAIADYTRADLKGTGAVPRIPPLRLRGGAELRQGAVRLRGIIEWNDRQKRVAAFEDSVPGFTLVNFNADWHPFGENGPLTLILSAENLFDVVARRAASFTRDYVPLTGRDIRITAKLDF